MPHFEEDTPVAKKYTPLSPTGTQFLSSPTFVAQRADQSLTGCAFQSIASLNADAIDRVTEQLDNFKLEVKRVHVENATIRNLENLENLAVHPSRVETTKYDDNLTIGNNTETERELDVDEGYVSGTVTPSPKEQLTPVHGFETNARPIAPNFDLKHTLTTTPKTQHFAKTISIHALHPSTYVEAGQILARYINLPFLKASLFPPKSKNGPKKTSGNGVSKANFYTSIEELNSCNSDGLAFAKALFCSKGKMMGKHRSSYSGTQYLGPWGSELESAPILVVKYLFVSRSFRRLGLARSLLNSLIESTNARFAKNGGKGSVEHVVVFPAVIKEDFAEELEGKSEEEQKEIEEREYRNAVGAYRALGFRRIGLSKWFALAVDEGHASRELAVGDDLDLEEDEN